MMNAAGVLTTRVAFTDLYVNDKYFGLYLIEEDFDHTYLKNRGHDLVNIVFNDTLGKNVKQYGNLLSMTNGDQVLHLFLNDPLMNHQGLNITLNHLLQWI
jgi:spore coat protein CotH